MLFFIMAFAKSFIFSRGFAIFGFGVSQALTDHGWSPAMTLANLAVALKGHPNVFCKFHFFQSNLVNTSI